MYVRKFRKEDAIKVYNIVKKNFLEINSKDYSNETINVLIEDSKPSNLIKKSKKRNYYVAIEKNEILGVGAYQNDNIHSFFVKTTVHRKGVGSKLMDRILKDAIKDKIKIMNCCSSPYAVKFYESVGFEKIEKKVVPFYNTKLHYILMKKKLYKFLPLL
jgi:N-acetylglutamate synthase-like GNAT family acetyltransferase